MNSRQARPVQYQRDMSTGRAKLHGRDDARDGKTDWTGAPTVLARAL